VLRTKLGALSEATGATIREMIFSSELILCNDGVFIIRNARKGNSNYIKIIPFSGSSQKARSEFNFHKRNEKKYSNMVGFYSFNYYELSHCNEYNVDVKAEEDFKIITSVNRIDRDEFIRCVADVIEIAANSELERGQFIFRGQVNDEWELMPKLFRDYPKSTGPNDAEIIELALCENLLCGEKGPYSNTYDPIELLLNLQHFGIPTRLLDWTSDVLIALFFACYDENEEYLKRDGNFYIIERSLYPRIKINSRDNRNLTEAINKETLDDFRSRLRVDEVKLIESVFKNPRLRVQDGCLMMFPFYPIDLNDNKYVTLHEFHKGRNQFIMRESNRVGTEFEKMWIANKRIDKSFKKAILYELSEIHGISKETLFVEIPHIENVSHYYSSLYQKAKEKLLSIKARH